MLRWLAHGAKRPGRIRIGGGGALVYGITPTPVHPPVRLITAVDLAVLTERVRRRVIRWFRMQRLLAAAAAADMLAWENSGFSVDASVRITLLPPQVRV